MQGLLFLGETGVKNITELSTYEQLHPFTEDLLAFCDGIDTDTQPS